MYKSAYKRYRLIGFVVFFAVIALATTYLQHSQYANHNEITRCEIISDSFISALQSHNYDKAYGYCSHRDSAIRSPYAIRCFEEQLEIEKKSSITSYAATGWRIIYQPIRFNYRSFQILMPKSLIQIGYRFQFIAPTYGTVTFEREGADWKIIQANIP